MLNRCFLGAVDYTLGGEIKKLEDLKELRDNPELAEIFRGRGLEHYAETELSCIDLAQTVARRTLAATRVATRAIDHVFYITETQKNEIVNTAMGLSYLLHSLGLERAQPMSLSGAACANPAQAIQLGSSLVRTGQARNVLVIVVEKVVTYGPFDWSFSPRLANEPGMPMGGSAYYRTTRLSGDLGMTVCSDGAASFLLSSNPELEYEVLSVGQHSAPTAFTDLLQDKVESFLRCTDQGIRVAVDAALRPLGRRQNDICRVLTNNCGMHIQRQIMTSAGFSMDQGFYDNIPRFGHAFSVDNMANLLDSDTGQPITVGDECMLLFCAMTTWGAVLLRKNTPLRPPPP